MEEHKLNLARKWRSKDFAHIVGQELPVRMLKNSLYKAHYFPVYLFAGQRGCGKTSTARVFAAAINCAQLPHFRTSPQEVEIPCGLCTSCVALFEGRHPDFIEIDAASHTGVENVRGIIDSSGFLPVMGSKKIYLIDEAHMLSKAAFNAFLKIMEEPPANVLFILATTDPHKIIDTVKSRCLQIFFKPIDGQALENHLGFICDRESIVWDKKGLALIVQETEGSARDAINLLEQVRFSQGSLTEQHVLRVLGRLSDKAIVSLVEHTLIKKPRELLQCMHNLNFASFSVEHTRTRMIEIVRLLLWIKHGVKPAGIDVVLNALGVIAKQSSLESIYALLQELCIASQQAHKSASQQALFEIALLHVCKMNKDDDSDGGDSGPSSQPAAQLTDDVYDDTEEGEDVDEQDEQEDEDDEQEDEEATQKLFLASNWQIFVDAIEALDDPLLSSIFKQGVAVAHTQANIITVEFAKDFAFFADVIESTKKTWQALLAKAFKASVTLDPQFIRPSVPTTQQNSSYVVRPAQEPRAPEVVQKMASKPTEAVRNNTHATHSYVKAAHANPPWRKRTHQALAELRIDVSNKEQWKKVNLVLQYFPGTVTEVREHTA